MHLVLLPGLACDQAIWAPVLPALEARADCVVPGYGTCASIEAMADGVLAAAPARFALAGHSMGGRVALEILRRAPRRVLRVALLDTGYLARESGAAGAAEAAERAALVDLAHREGMAAMGRRWLTGMVHPARTGDAALVGTIVAMVARQSAAAFGAQITALLARPGAAAVLGAIRCPTLIGCGRQDAWSPLARHQEMARLAGGARLVVFEDCGHMAPMERPPQVAAALVEWLDMTH